jgi:hypothetical protein
MHKNITKCNETLSKWCKNKHGASKIIDTFETYQHLMGNWARKRQHLAIRSCVVFEKVDIFLMICKFTGLTQPCGRDFLEKISSNSAGCVMRVNSTNILDEGLRIGGRATTRDSGIGIGTRCTQVHVPAMEDRYISLAI